MIEYSTVEQQIEKLKSQHLIIEDIESARDNLSLYGYSNLIKNYRSPYIYEENGEVFYRDGVTFEQICSLYRLDKNLRNSVMASMLDYEEYIKEAAADVVASAFGTHQDSYLLFRNYQNRRKRISNFSLASTLNKMKAALESGKDPIHHYMVHGGVVPPWILFKGIYLSTMVNFIDQFKRKEREALIHRLYDVDALQLDMSVMPSMMMNTMFTCLEYRNIAAHGGCIYNHSPAPCDCFPTFGGIQQLLSLLEALNYSQPGDLLHLTLSGELGRHCSMYPQDKEYLNEVLNIRIKMPDGMLPTGKEE